MMKRENYWRGNFFLRDRKNYFVELEDLKLLGRLYHNLSPLTLNLLNLDDFSLCLLGTTSFDLADLNLNFQIE